MRTNADCTIYNRYYDVINKVEKWQRTVIVAVAWENRKEANVNAAGGNMAVNSARVFIPFTRGAAHLDPKAWLALSNKANMWTLQEGDTVVKGAVTDEISGGFTISSLRAKYDNVLTITSVDTMDMGSESMHHWNVGLK